MLSAAEAALDQSAEDDKARERNRARLYAPPKGERARQGRTAAGAMAPHEAQQLISMAAAEDAKLRRAASG
ncbi:hypothetical protein [Streptomyces sp. NRRL B-1347]|uniref:hypothetical protein n=1 Tax=Streptomyces sp. NRRL B-1347 TaxID=1476877 RepID=UPI0004C9C8A5|nr:hypothetical protein [Streptomyces sp. NRRL B-1347]